MSHEFQQTEAIILKVTPFRDYDQILTLFSPHAGIIKVLYWGGQNKRQKTQGLCSPLTKVEIIYREKTGEIYSCRELQLMDVFPALRKELKNLEVGCDLLQTILTSQYVGKGSPLLYDLLCFYLRKIPLTFDPWILAASFRLKLLRIEGLAYFPLICNDCQKLIERDAYTIDAEGWCQDHKPENSLRWTEDELEFCYLLANCQQYSHIASQSIPQQLQKKISLFFDRCIRA